MKFTDLLTVLSIVVLTEKANGYFWGFAPTDKSKKVDNSPTANIQNEQQLVTENNDDYEGDYYDDLYDDEFYEQFYEKADNVENIAPISQVTNTDDNNTIADLESRRIHWLDFHIRKQLGFPTVPNYTEPVNIPPPLRDAFETEQYQREQEAQRHKEDIKNIFIYGSTYETQSYMWGFAPISTTVPPHNETVDSGVEISNGKTIDEKNSIMDDETLRLHWLDFQIKRQIGFPSVSDETAEPINIPTVLRDAMELEQAQREQAIPTRDNDIKSIFIYGTKHESCRTNLNYQHSCLQFNLSTTISPFDIADAELWVYKLRTDQNATFRVQDIVNVRHPKKESYFATKSAQQEEGWVMFTDNVRKTVKQWLHREHRDRPHVLDIACTDLSVECHENPIALTGPNKPFLLLTMGASAKRRHQRAKRQLQFCPPQMGCCLQSWEVDFSAYPLFKYIEYPRNFRPNYCKGDCNLFPQDIPQGNIRSSILREAGKESCCYPSKFTKQSVIYRDGSGMFISRELDLIVTECSCK